ncbi:hypothetical protein [Dyadobacter fermentans]|uniref:Uncharacterized protein n=1 Tax=Dyadobacter fermentans (strain ATCC 700827 / DSM 18053 / CIP 107007 / KCTC 52180 / NS114) TaxID=471854 RepID=C6VVF0_DYAFD|nr:hypothetical protein [Dyadobacter fermentans]ACT96680.1 hypothetical protein Dfer_5489 [Dyadobacter fermentans DSM 18053]
MKILINLFGGLVVSMAVIILASLEALVAFLSLRVNWSLVLVLGLSAVFISTFVKRKRYDRHG